MRIYFLYAICLIALVGCVNEQQDDSNKQTDLSDKQETNSDAYIMPKFTIEVPENKFSFSVSKEQVVVTEKNSRIYIPKNAFVQKDGNSVKGNVDLVFKEYQSQGEILASKLPMIYKSETGEIQNFESAGMFEIRVSQDGEELKLKEGKNIKVDLATTNSGAFNFYNLNDGDLAWNLVKQDLKPIKNNVKEELKNELKIVENQYLEKPKKAIELKPGDQIFDINIDFSEHERLSDLNGVMWKLTEDSVKTQEISQLLFKQDYDFIRLEPLESEDLEFQLYFIKRNDTIACKAAPVLKGKLLSRQKEKFKDLIAAIKNNVKRENNLRDQIKREKDLLRSFNVDQLGIYNYDRQFKEPGFVPMIANFIFENSDLSMDMEDVNVYLIPSSKNVVIRYTKETFDYFAINPKENNKIIAVLPNNEVYYLSNKDLMAMNLKNYKEKKVDITLKKYKEKIQKVENLDEFIAKI